MDNAQFKSSKKQKRVRKQIRQGKKKAEEERKSAEGTTYSSGKFNDINPLNSSSSDD